MLAGDEPSSASSSANLLDVNVLLTVVYLIIFIVGVVGNVCSCLVIADPRNRYMKTATNYYLFSLSVSDLLLLTFGLPHDLVNLWHPSPYLFNQFVCISRGWISEASTNASVLVIVAFTVERYIAICHPLRAHTFSHLSRAVKIIMAIWLVASSCALPVVMQYGVIEAPERQPDGQVRNQAQCTTVNRSETIFELSVILFFIIPMAMITILYVKLGCHLRHKSYLLQSGPLKSRLSQRPSASPRPSFASQSITVLGRDQTSTPMRLQHWLKLTGSDNHQRQPPNSATHLRAPLQVAGSAPARSRSVSQMAAHRTDSSSARSSDRPITSTTADCRRDVTSGHGDSKSVTLLLEDSSNNTSGTAATATTTTTTNALANNNDNCKLDDICLIMIRSADNLAPKVRPNTPVSAELSLITSINGAENRDRVNSNVYQATPSNNSDSSFKTSFAFNSTANAASMQSVNKMLVSVVVMFFICWAPFHAQRLMAIYVTDPTSEQEFIYSLLNHVSGISYYISAIVNPILYSLFSVKFRQALGDTFGHLRQSCRKPKACCAT